MSDPRSQTIWKGSAHGSGSQVLKEPLETEIWSVVVMNADGSAGVSVDGSFGMSVPFVFRVGLGLLLGGVFAAAVAGGMIFWGVRRQVPRPLTGSSLTSENRMS